MSIRSKVVWGIAELGALVGGIAIAIAAVGAEEHADQAERDARSEPPCASAQGVSVELELLGTAGMTTSYDGRAGSRWGHRTHHPAVEVPGIVCPWKV